MMIECNEWECIVNPWQISIFLSVALDEKEGVLFVYCSVDVFLGVSDLPGFQFDME